MLALRFYAPEDVRLEDIPEPECGPREVKIKVKACSTCGTDVKIKKNGHVNITRTTTMGHEIAGEVVEVGADAQGGFQLGDRVQCIAAVPCGDCYECRRGWLEVCRNQTSVGYQYDGGFAEYMIVPEQVLKVDGLNRIPDNVGYDEASAAEPFACAINAQEQLGIEEGDFTVDVVAEVLRLTGGRGADVIITATPANITQEQAISMAARQGRISFFGGLPKNDPFIKCDSNLVHYRQLHIHGANGSSPEHNRKALEYISTGQVPVKDLITKKVALADVMSVFDIVAKGEAIKVTVEP